MAQAESLVAYIKSLVDFTIVSSIGGCYDHMGAMLTDAILQAGINYETVVRPRAERVKSDYPEARTTSGFARILEQNGAEKVLQWKSGAKPERLLSLVALLLRSSIETENQFREWLQRPESRRVLMQLNGIKDKTVHYLFILVGGETVAVDQHLFQFLSDAGLPTRDYETAHKIINDAAGILGVRPSILDHSIWRYMSRRSGTKACAANG